MRILFTFAGTTGHFLPLVPIARAAQKAGHTVAFGARDDLVERVRAEGFDAFGVEAAQPPDVGIAPILEVDRPVAQTRARDSFALTLAPVRAPGVLDAIRSWHPDVVVLDEMDFGSAIAAEHAGLPHATVLVIAAGELVQPELYAEPLDRLRAEYGLPPDPDLTRLNAGLVLSPFPPRFRDPAYPLPATAESVRASAPLPVDGEGHDLPIGRDGRPTVYFTLGTVFNVRSGDLFERVLAGLSELDVNLIVTVGPQIDPERFGPQPDHVHLRRYVAQGQVLPHCDLVVTHGGSGSVTGTLEYGVPLVVLPLGADQIHNAARCTALGVGLTLDPVRADPEQIRDAAATVLADPAYRRAAAGLSAENAALPDADHAVRLLVELVEKHQANAVETPVRSSGWR